MTDTRRRIPIVNGASPAGADKAPAGHHAAPGRAGPAPESAAPPVPPEETGASSAGAPDETVAAPEADAPSVQLDPLAAVAAERDEYLDGLRRLKAEFDNFRKRAQRDAFEAGTRARLSVLTELLPVLDNLERALSAAEHHEEGKVLEGVRMTHAMFADLLRKEGVQEIDALGAIFDPTQHEALMSQPSELPEGTVTAVIERGYESGDRLVRPAKVVVSSGPAET